MSCECKYKFDGRKYNSSQVEKTINADASVKIPENIKGVKNIIYGTLEHVLMKTVII